MRLWLWAYGNILGIISENTHIQSWVVGYIMIGYCEALTQLNVHHELCITIVCLKMFCVEPDKGSHLQSSYRTDQHVVKNRVQSIRQWKQVLYITDVESIQQGLCRAFAIDRIIVFSCNKLPGLIKWKLFCLLKLWLGLINKTQQTNRKPALKRSWEFGVLLKWDLREVFRWQGATRCWSPFLGGQHWGRDTVTGGGVGGLEQRHRTQTHYPQPLPAHKPMTEVGAGEGEGRERGFSSGKWRRDNMKCSFSEIAHSWQRRGLLRLLGSGRGQMKV